MPFLIPPWWRYAALGALLLAVGISGLVYGFGLGSERLEAYIGRQAVQAGKIAKAREIVTQKVITRYVKVQGETKTVTETVEKEVTRYAETNPSLRLDSQWRMLHDHAATNTVPRTAPGPDGASGAPTAASALATVTANYAACHRTADRLDSLQEWIREQRRLSGG